MQSIPELSSDGLALLLLIRAAALRSLRGEIDKFDVLDNPQTVVDYLHAKLSRDPIVRTYVLLLNGSNRLITAEELQRGTVDHVEVYPRDVMKRCLETGATGVILAQNHPGGDPLPTDSDKEVTRLIAIAAYPLSIKLLDHVVIGNGRWYSFQAHGLLDAITRSPSVVQVPHSGRCTDHSRAHLYGQRRWFDCDYPDD
jgi:DNA repair protein RadC